MRLRSYLPWALGLAAIVGALVLAFCLFCDARASSTSPALAYKQEVFVASSPFQSLHGLAVDESGNLYAGSVVGQSIFKIDKETGRVERFVAGPEGMADDLEVGPGNQLVWTHIMGGKVYSLDLNDANAKPKLIAQAEPGFNPIAFRKDGRLYSALTFLGDKLYEIDPQGVKAPRMIIENVGGFNGFDFGPDDKLYAPIWFKKQVVRFDVDTGKMDVLSGDFGRPAALNFDSKGQMYVLDTHRGEVVQMDYKTGARKIVARTPTSTDNLVITADDRLFVSNMADGDIDEVNLSDGSLRKVVDSKLTAVGGLAFGERDGRPTLYVASIFALNAVDVDSGEIRNFARAERDEFSHPVNVTVLGDKLIATSWEGGQLAVYDIAGEKMMSLRNGLAFPQGVVGLDDKNLLVSSNKDNKLLKVPFDVTQKVEDFGAGLEGAGPMVRVGDVVYVSEIGAGKVTRISLKDKSRRVIAQGLDSPEGIAALADGHLVVAEAGAGRLLLIDPENGEKMVIGKNLPTGIADVEGFPAGWLPSGVTVAPNGDIYLAADRNSSILRFRRQ